MKKKWIFIILVFFLSASVGAQAAAADSKDLELVLEISNPELPPSTPLFYQVALKNLSSRSVTLKTFSLNPLTGVTTFHIRKKGEEVFKEWGYEKLGLYAFREVQIQGKESRDRESVLFYDELSKGFPLSEPRGYEIKAVYESHEDNIREESNLVEITVRPPSADEKAAAELIRKDIPAAQHLAEYGVREQDLKTLEALSRYEKTLLGQYALFQLGKFWLRKAENEKEKDERINLVRKAQEFFNKVPSEDPALPFRAELLYYKGYSYGYLDDMTTVRSIWDVLMKDYPTSSYTQKAQEHLKILDQMEAAPKT